MTGIYYCLLTLCCVWQSGILPGVHGLNVTSTEATDPRSSTSSVPSAVTSPMTATSTTVATELSTTPGRPLTTTSMTTSAKNDSGCEMKTSCKSCTSSRKCFWCSGTKKCASYPASKVIPRDCPKNDWYWEQCVVSGFLLIIIVPSVAGLVLLACGCFIYCKCCRTEKTWKKEEERITQRRKDRAQKSEERKADRQARADAIRMKYGLLKSDDEEPLI